MCGGGDGVVVDVKVRENMIFRRVLNGYGNSLVIAYMDTLPRVFFCALETLTVN